MPIRPVDSFYVGWRAREAGADEDALNPYASMIEPDLQAVTERLGDPTQPARPQSGLELDIRGEKYPLSDSRVAFVGAGAGTVIMASYLANRGVNPDNITIFDPSGSFGGQWQDPDVQFGGFNNPMPLSFGRRHHLPLYNRDGREMLAYLQGIAQTHLSGVNFVQERVEAVSRQKSEEAWLLRPSDGIEEEADLVVLASGNPVPNRINSSRISSNLDEFPTRSVDGSFAVERNQRALTSEELRMAAEGKPIVIIGLGNSMAAMIHQIQQYENNAGAYINYMILTDRSWDAVNYPYESHDGKKSIFRDPANGYLTGYSADLVRDDTSYYRALGENRILDSIDQIYYDEVRQTLAIVDINLAEIEVEEPMVFALIGHGADSSLFGQVGASGQQPGVSSELIRPVDGAIYSREHGGFMSGVFAVGSVAATSANRNALVIPGIQGQVPSSTLTIGVRSIVENMKWRSNRNRIGGLALDAARLGIRGYFDEKLLPKDSHPEDFILKPQKRINLGGKEFGDFRFK